MFLSVFLSAFNALFRVFPLFFGRIIRKNSKLALYKMIEIIYNSFTYFFYEKVPPC